MKPRHQVSRVAIDMIKRFEGCRRTAAALPGGGWTIGYGHVRSARERAEVSPADAEALLIYDLLEVTGAVNDWTFTPLTQNQFDALVSFAFNIGLENFRRSLVLRRVNEGALIQAACALEMWREAELDGERIVVDALVRRRAAEKTLFLTPPGGWVPAPTPVVRPRLDLLADAAPRLTPAAIVAPLDGPVAAFRDIGPETVRPVKPEVHVAEPDSPVQQAAAAVVERLQALAPDEQDVTPAAPGHAALEATADAEPAPAIAPIASRPSALGFNFRLATPPASTPEPPEPANAPAEGEEAAAEPVLAAGAHLRKRMFPARRRPGSRVGGRPASVWPFVGLGAVGLVVAVAGVYWGFGPHAEAGAVSARPVGWVAGVIGVVCLASAVYFLLERLGGRED